MHITGNMVDYYFVCKRKLWLFQHNIDFEQTNENVRLGKILDENSYRDYNLHHIALDNEINIDMIQNWQVLHEVKKSTAIENSAIWQLKYYIYYLRKKGINISKGMIDYPLIRKCIKIDYSDEDQKQMEKYLADIERICKQSVPPKPVKKSICKNCAFYEYCFG